jgi:hypothetical protein
MATPTASLNTVKRMAASLLNAAGWKNYLHGSINVGSGNLTVTDAAFTADDVGKAIAIDGAGQGGTTYEGIITVFTDATHVTVSPIAATSVAGATVSYGGRLHDDRRNLFELREGAFEADELHYLAIAETPTHWMRPELTDLSVELTHNSDLGDLVPHLGPLGRVFITVDGLSEFIPGRRAEPEEIERMRLNTGISPLDTYGSKAHNAAGSLIGGYFWMPIEENTIKLTGDAAKVYHIPPYTRGSDLKTAAIYTGSIASCLVSRLLAKEGAKTPELARVHASYCEAIINGIRSGEQRVPTLEEYQREMPPGRQ